MFGEKAIILIYPFFRCANILCLLYLKVILIYPFFMCLMAEQIYKFNHSEYLFKHSAVLKSFIALRNILWFLSLNFEGCFNFKLRWLQVDTVEGLRDLQIPSGIQPGDSVKLSCLGVPDINKPSVRGDHYFIVNVLIPKDIRSVFFWPSFSYFLYP